MSKTIRDLLVINEDSGEEVVEGFKDIETIIEELQNSKIVLYLSYPGGLKLQLAIHNVNQAIATRNEQIEAGDSAEFVSDMVTEAEKSLIYAAYLMS